MNVKKFELIVAIPDDVCSYLTERSLKEEMSNLDVLEQCAIEVKEIYE